jgi:hypothetical protein
MSAVLGLPRTKWICWTLRALCCLPLAVPVIACAPLPPTLPSVGPDATATPVASSPANTIPSPSVPPSEQQVPALDQPDASGPARALPFDSPAGLAAYDLATRLGVDPQAVVILQIEEAEFPVSGLGCMPAARDGDTGAEAGTVPGQEITLAVDDQEYVYRAIGWDVTLCAPEAESSGLTLPLSRYGVNGAPIQAAREALAQQIGVPAESVEVRSVAAVNWPDTSLGCAEPDMMYAQVITPGFLMLLDAGGRVHEVHSDLHRVVICDKALDTDS